MVLGKQRTKLDAEANVDVQILSDFYNKPSRSLATSTRRNNSKTTTPAGSASYYSPKDASRLLKKGNIGGNSRTTSGKLSETVVLSLSDVSAARQYSNRRMRLLPRKLLLSLCLLPIRRLKGRKNHQAKRKEKTDQTTQRGVDATFAMDNYERDIVKTLSSGGMSAIIGASTESLIDDTSQSSSSSSASEDEILSSYLHNDDEYSGRSNGGSSSRPDSASIQDSEYQDGYSFNTTDVTIPTQSAWSFTTPRQGDAGDPNDGSDPLAFLSWMFGCSETNPFPSRRGAKKKTKFSVGSDKKVGGAEKRQIERRNIPSQEINPSGNSKSEKEEAPITNQLDDHGDEGSEDFSEHTE